MPKMISVEKIEESSYDNVDVHHPHCNGSNCSEPAAMIVQDNYFCLRCAQEAVNGIMELLIEEAKRHW